MTGSGPGLARPAGSTLAAKHPCKRVKAKEPGRAEVEAAKAKEAEAKAEDSPRNRARQLRSRRLPPPAQPAAAAAPAAPKQPAAPAADGTGGTPSQEGIQAKAPPVSKPKQKAMPQVVQPKAKAVEEKAKAATPGLMRATPKPPPPPPRERGGRTYKFIVCF